MLLIPHKRKTRAPGLLYIHWHAGMYDLGKEQLLTGVEAQPAYAPVCVEKGFVTLAIDSWCFGERKHDSNGGEGEQNAFKLMLWKGQVLYGMMMFDEFRALDYLANRPEVDSKRLGAMGMSMGATKAWWLAALDPRVSACMDICCLTDYEELIKTHGPEGARSLLLRAIAAEALPDSRDQRADRASTSPQRERPPRSSNPLLGVEKIRGSSAATIS